MGTNLHSSFVLGLDRHNMGLFRGHPFLAAFRCWDVPPTAVGGAKEWLFAVGLLDADQATGLSVTYSAVAGAVVAISALLLTEDLPAACVEAAVVAQGLVTFLDDSAPDEVIDGPDLFDEACVQVDADDPGTYAGNHAIEKIREPSRRFPDRDETVRQQVAEAFMSEVCFAAPGYRSFNYHAVVAAALTVHWVADRYRMGDLAYLARGLSEFADRLAAESLFPAAGVASQ